MEPLTLASVGVGLYNFGQALAAGAKNYSSNNNQKETVSVDERAYEPITSLFVAAMIPLLTDHQQINIKFYYGSKVVRLCPDTYIDRLKRTASQASPEKYCRLQSKAWIGIAVRAICLYDLDKNDERAEAIKFVFKKAIEGLIIHLKTYKSAQDASSRKASEYILEAISFLKYKSGEIKHHEERARVADKLQRRTDKLKQKVKDQKVELIDSRDFWCSYPSESADTDLLVLKVKEFKLVYERKERQQTSIDPMTDDNFKEELESFTQYIHGRQKRWPEFLKFAKHFEFSNEEREAPADYDDAEFD
jgi:hypothetical protein